MGPKLLRRETELRRKLNLSKLPGNTKVKKPQLSLSQIPLEFLSWSSTAGAGSPWAGATPIPGQSLELRKTETPKSKKNPIEPRCARTFLSHPFSTPQDLSPSGVEQRGAPGEFQVSWFLTPSSHHPAQPRALISPTDPFHLRPGTANKEPDTILFARASCRGEWS